MQVFQFRKSAENISNLLSAQLLVQEETGEGL
jgi:hypothetical protein